MTRIERMGFVDAWLRSDRTPVEFAEYAGLDTDAFLCWILEYGRPSPLIPVRILAGAGEPQMRAGDIESVSRPPGLGLVSSGAEHHWIPVVIQVRP